jgi:hypothetical protein
VAIGSPCLGVCTHGDPIAVYNVVDVVVAVGCSVWTRGGRAGRADGVDPPAQLTRPTDTPPLLRYAIARNKKNAEFSSKAAKKLSIKYQVGSANSPRYYRGHDQSWLRFGEASIRCTRRSSIARLALSSLPVDASL